jgi:peptidoglycan/xylan/chitin deacetylase (PgdA/CDA1 family)
VNRYLSVSDELFEMMVETLPQMGYEIITMSEVYSRLKAGRPAGRFVCLTFDDGYRDNYEVAFRISLKYKIPIVVYVATGLVDRTAVEWWRGVEALVTARSEVRVPGRSTSMRIGTEREKTTCYRYLSQILATIPAGRKEELLQWLSEENGFDIWEPMRSLPLEWNLIRRMHESGLVEFGAHTVRHVSLASLKDSEVADEMTCSANRLSSQLGIPVRHFAYPYGSSKHASEREFRICRELGFATGVTTRHGTLTLEHRNAMHSLPRLTLNGDFAKLRNVKVFASGAMMALQNGRVSGGRER